MDATLIQALIGFLVLPYTVLTGRLHMKVSQIEDRLDKTYSKQETREIIDLLVNPLKETTEKLIASQNRLIEALHKVDLQLVRNER